MTRKWFQIHLSTALIVLLFLSTFMWLNLRLKPDNVSDPVNPHYYQRGFPFRMNDTRKDWQTSFYWTMPKNMLMSAGRRATAPDGLEGQWFILPALLNAGIAMLFCGFSGITSE